jgi:hypothetical protein
MCSCDYLENLENQERVVAGLATPSACDDVAATVVGVLRMPKRDDGATSTQTVDATPATPRGARRTRRSAPRARDAVLLEDDGVPDGREALAPRGRVDAAVVQRLEVRVDGGPRRRRGPAARSEAAAAGVATTCAAARRPRGGARPSRARRRCRGPAPGGARASCTATTSRSKLAHRSSARRRGDDVRCCCATAARSRLPFASASTLPWSSAWRRACASP